VEKNGNIFSRAKKKSLQGDDFREPPTQFVALRISVNIPFTLDRINCYANLRVSTHNQRASVHSQKPHKYYEPRAMCNAILSNSLLLPAAGGERNISPASPARLFPFAKYTRLYE